MGYNWPDYKIDVDESENAAHIPRCTLIKANPSAFVVVGAAPCVSIRISTSTESEWVCAMWILWFTERRRRRRPPPRALSQPLHLLLYDESLGAAWQLLREYVLCFNPRYAPPLNHHPPAYTGVLKSTKLHRLSAKWKCDASSETRARREREIYIYYIYTCEEIWSALLSASPRAHSARGYSGCIVIDSSGSAAAALLHFVGFESLRRPTATSMIPMAHFKRWN